MKKYSRQKEAILQNLRSRKDHPTADMVYECVRKEIPNISLGTVYRNLATLEQDGEILRLTTENGPDHYDGTVMPHVHFVCRRCGRVSDMDFAPCADMMEQASKGFAGTIEGYTLQFRGVCGDCNTENQN